MLVHGYRVGKLDQAFVRSDETVPERQKRVGNTIEQSSTTGFPKGHLFTYPSEIQQCAQVEAQRMSGIKCV
ncbi:MAG: hypothetical protein KatS3mg023_1689 [Armatimonadota bacterium]|nr:MAG: hypothetical protein KatS3mg023_1689 [Armatimonadota bacterium]